MWILFVIMTSGGASSSNITHAEFQTKTACEQAKSVLIKDVEVKSVYCFKK